MINMYIEMIMIMLMMIGLVVDVVDSWVASRVWVENLQQKNIYSLRKGSAKMKWQRREWEANNRERGRKRQRQRQRTTTTGIVLLLLLPALLNVAFFSKNRTGQFYFYHGMQFIYKNGSRLVSTSIMSIKKKQNKQQQQQHRV